MMRRSGNYDIDNLRLNTYDHVISPQRKGIPLPITKKMLEFVDTESLINAFGSISEEAKSIARYYKDAIEARSTNRLTNQPEYSIHANHYNDNNLDSLIDGEDEINAFFEDDIPSDLKEPERRFRYLVGKQREEDTLSPIDPDKEFVMDITKCYPNVFNADKPDKLSNDENENGFSISNFFKRREKVSELVPDEKHSYIINTPTPMKMTITKNRLEGKLSDLIPSDYRHRIACNVQINETDRTYMPTSRRILEPIPHKDVSFLTRGIV